MPAALLAATARPWRLAALAGLLLTSLVGCSRSPSTTTDGAEAPHAPNAPAPAAANASPTATSTPVKTVAERFGDAPLLSLIDAGRGLAMNDGSTLPLTASTCGGCHVDVYQEWQGATHAAALGDLQYLAELSKADTPRWLCLNCHIPLAEQRPYVVDGAQRVEADAWKVGALVDPAPQPDFSEALQHEAITCATCHVREGEDGRGVVVGPRNSGRAPHAVRHDPDGLRSICVRCHSPGPVALTPTFFCWFETAEELAAARGIEKEAAAKLCVECHMPATSRPVAPGAPRVTTRRHTWWGGGVPKHFDGLTQRDSRGFRSGVEVETKVTSTEAGLRAQVTLTNTNAGHKVPTADPERFLLVDVRLFDDAGAVLARQSTRIGQQWDFGDVAHKRPARRLADNRLAEGEVRALDFELPATPSASRLVVDVKHVRLTASNALYAARAPVDDVVRGFRPDVDTKLPDLWRHYPLFAWVFREERALSAQGPGAPKRLDSVTLSKLSAETATWPLQRLQAEIEPKP